MQATFTGHFSYFYLVDGQIVYISRLINYLERSYVTSIVSFQCFITIEYFKVVQGHVLIMQQRRRDSWTWFVHVD